MLILTEKPSVARDFASALKCKFSDGVYTNGKQTITNCVGHLFQLCQPSFYNEKYASWRELPVIPQNFSYSKNPSTEKQANIVVKKLKEHRNDSILIATDADREGEIIARECLAQAGISDFSKIRRFWVSQALTPEVIIDGIRNAKPLSEYNALADKGFARQHADWLVGINFTRYISVSANTKLTVGRVQTAILSAIEQRCDKIENFVSEEYFEHYGIFQNNGTTLKCKGIYVEQEKTSFGDKSREPALKSLKGQKAALKDKKEEIKTSNPPSLYNLNEAQKDAFKLFGLSAKETLEVIQSLYENLKCVSYPRTPSKVMGSANVELCRRVNVDLSKKYPEYLELSKSANISSQNSLCFNDAKLEAHHALIPLAPLPGEASEIQKKIYFMILKRFFLAFQNPCKYKKTVCVLQTGNFFFRLSGIQTIDTGWKKYLKGDEEKNDEKNENEEEQSLENFDLASLYLKDVETAEKWTKPPKYFNEASILSFMENPKNESEKEKLVGLGTAATRHTFIPKLLKEKYIDVDKKRIRTTDFGKSLVKLLKKTSLSALSDINETTRWEEKLDADPKGFEKEIKEWVSKTVSEKIQTNTLASRYATKCQCPLCKKPILENSKSYYCGGYKSGCKFPSVWKEVCGAKISKTDLEKLLSGGKTGLKTCTSKNGKEFKCRFALDENYKIKFIFEDSKKKR